ncbi:MAG: hypothetical protein ACE5GW_02405, partial [Planctomycetota bacterium]
FDEENPHPDLRWDLLDPRRFDELEYRQGILARLFPGAPAGVAGLLAHGGGLDRSPWEFLSMGDPDALPQRALMAMRWPQESGLLALVARTSPEGGPLLDDIHMLDWTDEGEWLLMVAIPDGERTLLYRRLYHEEER